MNEATVESVLLRAAMIHLNLVMLHPSKDGSSRTIGCIQTAVLTSDGNFEPTCSSIEEYIGRNQQEYCDMPAEVGGGGWHPQRDAQPWVRYCLTGHYRQARTPLLRMREPERTYA